MSQAYPDDLQSRLLATFEVEAEEHLQALNRHLLTLERERGEVPETLLAELFREAHSMKGAARVVGLQDVEAQSHGLEELFVNIREGRVVPGPDSLDRAFRTLDAIRAALGGADRSEDAASEPVEAPGTGLRPAEETVRIATSKLDALMADVGELLVARIGTEQRRGDLLALETSLAKIQIGTRKPRSEGSVDALEAVCKGMGELRRRFEADARRMGQVVSDLQDDVRRARMLPLATVFEPFSRMVRDLARDRAKDIVLVVAGGETEVDRSVLEQIKDPLTHLLRNCVDHGIEAPAMRVAAGKPSSGTISLTANARGDALAVVVGDDGAGIDVDAARRDAVRKGHIGAAAAAELSDRQAMSLIFRSGVSTSPIITDVSGRGVGLDVVRDAVERMHGSVEVESHAGRGTTFALSLPLSVSTMHGVLIDVGAQTFALPVSSVERIVRAGTSDIERAEGREVVRVDGRPVALARLSDVLGVAAGPVPAGTRYKLPVVVVGTQHRRIAFLVERLNSTHELVIKSLPAPLSRVRHIAGATILGSGEVAMILSAADLIESVERARGPSIETARDDVEPSTILVVEDSITTRTLERSILEGAGYRVHVAANGAEGWRLLQANAYDLVVSDIEMPEMDGFELIAKIRADPRHPDLPVVLVTSHESREDRERGIDAGADAYIVKGAFDQDRLLETIRRLI